MNSSCVSASAAATRSSTVRSSTVASRSQRPSRGNLRRAYDGYRAVILAALLGLAPVACGSSATPKAAPAPSTSVQPTTTTTTTPAPTTSTLPTAEAAYVDYVHNKLGNHTDSAALISFGHGVCTFAAEGTLTKNLTAIASIQAPLIPTYRAVLIGAGEKLCPDQVEALNAGMAALG